MKLRTVFAALSGLTFACLKAGAGPGNSQPSGICRPLWRLPPCLYLLWQQQGLWTQQCCPGRGRPGGNSLLYVRQPAVVIPRFRQFQSCDGPKSTSMMKTIPQAEGTPAKFLLP